MPKIWFRGREMSKCMQLPKPTLQKNAYREVRVEAPLNKGANVGFETLDGRSRDSDQLDGVATKGARTNFSRPLPPAIPDPEAPFASGTDPRCFFPTRTFPRPSFFRPLLILYAIPNTRPFR